MEQFSVISEKNEVNSDTQGLFSIDSNWMVQSWNKSAEKLLGVGAKKIVGKNLWSVFPRGLSLRYHYHYKKAFSQDIPVHFEEFWPEKNIWFEVIAFKTGPLLTISFNCCKEPLQKLKKQNELYKHIAEVTNDCLWEWHPKHNEFYWIDGGHSRVFGYPLVDSVVPQIFWENKIHPEDIERILAHLKKALSDPNSSQWDEQYRFKKANGEYAFVHDRGHIIHQIHSVIRIVGATQDISEKVMLEKKVIFDRIENQIEITAAVINAHETEREVIGLELHDNVNQILGAIKLYIETAKNDAEKRDSFLNKSVKHLVSVIEIIRNLSKRMAPLGLMELSLSESLSNMVTDLTNSHGIIISLGYKNIKKDSFNKVLQLNIFRIIQEQLNNIVKHSAATQAEIKVQMLGKKIIILITDNGTGCDLKQKVSGVGLRNITSRAELYRGNVITTSKPGKGFSLKVTMIKNEAA